MASSSSCGRAKSIAATAVLDKAQHELVATRGSADKPITKPSNKGCKITKENVDGRIIQVEAGKWLQKTLNKYSGETPQDLDINYDYYIQAAEREIKNIEPELMSYRQYILF